MVRKMLRSVVQTLQWTYSLFWQLRPEQGMLVWADGCYNGTIRTRKVVQPSELTEEEACLQRSQQLWELYESLSAGEDTTLQQLRGPCAALSPEDLTETEWFYLVCMSFAFPPGSGLPGKAYEGQQTIWLSRANEADRNVSPRVLLAKSAQIQTILCIPLEDGVLELGTIDRVEEDLALIHRVRSIFTGGQHSHITQNTKSTISELSTSEPNMPSSTTSQQLFHLLTPSAMHSSANVEGEFADDVADEYEDNHPVTPTLVSDHVGAENNREDTLAVTHPWDMVPEEILMTSPEHISNNFCSNLPLLPTLSCTTSYSTGQSHKVWPLDDDATDINSKYSETTRIEDVPQDDAHYSLIVTTILRCDLGTNVGLGSDDRLRRHPRRSAFIGWTRQRDSTLLVRRAGNPIPQRLLRYTLCRVPYLYEWCKDQSTMVQRNTEEASGNLHRCIAQEESSTNHVLAERKRREKLNERFLVLKSLVPVTKMDKASILGDTIEYIKQLLRRIQEYEIQMKLMEGEKRRRSASGPLTWNSKEHNISMETSTSPAIEMPSTRHKMH